MKIERLGGIINSYLYNNNIKTKEFARKSDLSETYIRDILHEKKIKHHLVF